MNKAISIIKTAVICILIVATIFLIFGEPDENSATWYMDFLLSKAIGLTCLGLIRVLFRLWSQKTPD